MNHAPDEIDQMLRDYAPRWRAAQPAPPAVDRAVLVARRHIPIRRPAWWVPALAVATAVAVIAGGTGLIRSRTPRQTGPPVSTTPTSTPGVVSWAPLPPSGGVVPAISLPPSPDPAGADGLPPCHAANLQVSSERDGAGGTRYLFLTFTAIRSCRLGGYPSVTALDGSGRTLAVPVQREASSGQYGYPVAVGSGAPATLSLGWSSAWCAAEIDVARLRVVLPDGGGTVTTDGFGQSACYGTPGSGEKAPIIVRAFTPQTFTPARVVTAFDGVSVEPILPESIAAGGRLRFAVVLTAPAGPDVPLEMCPDYRINIGDVHGSTEATYALNCAAVAYRDAAGHPYLPGGTPVRFEMEADAPNAPAAAAKLVWQLLIPDPVVGGGTVDIR